MYIKIGAGVLNVTSPSDEIFIHLRGLPNYCSIAGRDCAIHAARSKYTTYIYLHINTQTAHIHAHCAHVASSAAGSHTNTQCARRRPIDL